MADPLEFEYEDEEILAQWKSEDRQRAMSEQDLREREQKFGTKTKRESLLDLREAAQTPPFQRRKKSLNSINEEEEERGGGRGS